MTTYKRGAIVSLKYDEALVLARIYSTIGYTDPTYLAMAIKLPDRLYKAAGVASPFETEAYQIYLAGKAGPMP